MRKKIWILFAVVFTTGGVLAHPMPHSVMLLDVRKDGIAAQLQLPLKELQLVFPDEDLDSGYATLISRKSKWLNSYLLQHFTMTDSTGQEWKMSIKGKSVTVDEQLLTGKYHELIFELWLQPPAGISPRHFMMHYDAIMHHLVTHKMLIKISHDWYGGLSAKDSNAADVGVLAVNTSDGTILPVVVNLDEGSHWTGFEAMVHLGIKHIAEGTDHLLFLLVLVLPATLIAEGKRWATCGGTKCSVWRLLKIATAFTIGHSVSLLFGAMKWLVLPQQPVEVAIAFTILITAIHAIRPLFFEKEIFIGAGFGLIHGLAFAEALSELNINGNEMAISILGFNIGIELMQLFVIICTVPWLIILSKYSSYNGLRIAGAVFAIVASVAWIVERITNQPNVVSGIVQEIANEGKWIVAVLALLAVTMLLFKVKRIVKSVPKVDN